MGRPVDIAGQKFNALTAISPTDRRNSEGIMWLCRCDCGKNCYVSAKSLRNGNTKSCGCLRGNALDLTDRVFGRLTAIKKTSRRDTYNNIIWYCRCECGGDALVSSHDLVRGNTQSCGCLKYAGIEAIRRYEAVNAINIDGTRIVNLNLQKPPANNTSGHIGVSWVRQKNKWAAHIKFRGKKYHLGLYVNIDDAVRARQAAQRRLHGAFLDWYYAQYPDRRPKTQD